MCFLIICTFAGMIYARFLSQNCVVWLISALILGGCTHPVYPVSRVYFNNDLGAIPPSGVTKFGSEVSSVLMTAVHLRVYFVLQRLQGHGKGFTEGPCAHLRVVRERYQRFPCSCINMHQVTFQTENHSSLSAMLGTNKNRQKTTMSLLTIQAAPQSYSGGDVRTSSDHLQSVRSVTVGCMYDGQS